MLVVLEARHSCFERMGLKACGYTTGPIDWGNP